MSCTNISRHQQLNAWRRILPHVQETFSYKTRFFKMDPSARKLQESGNKQNKIKENYLNSQIIYTNNQ